MIERCAKGTERPWPMIEVKTSQKVTGMMSGEDSGQVSRTSVAYLPSEASPQSEARWAR